MKEEEAASSSKATEGQEKEVSIDESANIIGYAAGDGENSQSEGQQVEAAETDEEIGGEPANQTFKAHLHELNPAISAHLHNIVSFKVGQSKIETLAAKIEQRRVDRVPVTFPVRVEFLRTCRKIAVAKGYERKTRIHFLDLLEYRQRVSQEVGESHQAYNKLNRLQKYWRIINDKNCLLDVLDKAIDVVENSQFEEDDWLYYQDFNFYHTFLVSRWPWGRHGALSAALTVFAFYAFSPILFCTILNDQNICPDGESVSGMIRNSLYFASTTMSTVGYGDLTLTKDEPWKVLIGTLYMLLAMYVAVTAFSAAAETAFTSIKGALRRFFPTIRHIEGPFEDGEYLYQRVRKIQILKFTEIILSFVIMNLLFIFAARLYFRIEDNIQDIHGSNMNWMDAFYVAVQTTTTIGYGDYTVPEEMRWFMVLYLTTSTYLTGNALGQLGSLHSDLEQVRRYHAWHRRSVTKHTIQYMSSTRDQIRVDQFEFAVASLLDLGKISADDLRPIMSKYRSLSSKSGYIEVINAPDEKEMDLDQKNMKNKEGAEGT